MLDNINLKKISKTEFKKYYKTHCDLDSKMNQLLFYLVPLYKEYNDIYQNNIISLREAGEEGKFITRLNNLHQEVKKQQERIYINRLQMNKCLQNNSNLDADTKREYANNLIKIYKTNIENNKNKKKNVTNLNNECIEPYFDTKQRLFFNIKCNNNNNISDLKYLQNYSNNENNNKLINEIIKNDSTNHRSNKKDTLPIHDNNELDNTYNNQSLLSRINENGLSESNNNSKLAPNINIYNNRNNKISNKSNQFNIIKKNNISNANFLQPNRDRSSFMKSKKRIKTKNPNKRTKFIKKNELAKIKNDTSLPSRPNMDKPNVDINTNSNSSNDGIDIAQLDKAYLNKHNELINVYNAYQILFNKVNKYKDEIDRVKSLSTSKLINNTTMNKMLDDQKYVMNSVDKMQEELINKKILKPEERIPTHPVVSHPQNMNHFNNTLKEQINSVVSNNKLINSDIKKKMFNILNRERFINSEDVSNTNQKLINISTLDAN